MMKAPIFFNRFNWKYFFHNKQVTSMLKDCACGGGMDSLGSSFQIS